MDEVNHSTGESTHARVSLCGANWMSSIHSKHACIYIYIYIYMVTPLIYIYTYIYIYIYISIYIYIYMGLSFFRGSLQNLIFCCCFIQATPKKGALKKRQTLIHIYIYIYTLCILK